jgi:ribosomal protein S18 acetylase RimI-like enzyme
MSSMLAGGLHLRQAQRRGGGDPEMSTITNLYGGDLGHRMTAPALEPFGRAHLDGLIALVGAEGWTEYTDDPERTHRALTAPGLTTLVAVAGRRVVGAIQVQSDGAIQAHVSMLLIDRSWRGAGLGSTLLREGFVRAGGLQMDIRTRTEGYYERLGARRSLGFRLTRADLGLPGAATG